jgi:hypothetical protein
MKAGSHHNRRRFIFFALFGALGGGVRTCPGQWTQWGGPHRDFKAPAGKLADKWPSEGPPQLWRRDLGEGYSAILADQGRLYTMYRRDGQERTICLDANSSRTIWEDGFSVEPYEQMVRDFGKGPIGTPILMGDTLITVGVTGIIKAFEVKTGKVLWSHDLVKEFDGKIHEFGYACSPMAYGKNVIVPVAGKSNGLMAFDSKTGRVAWKSPKLDISYASPILIQVGGEDQIVFMTPTEVVGVAADGGALRWRYPHNPENRNNCFMPVWDEAGSRLFVASHSDIGAKLLQIGRSGDHWSVKEIWADPKIRLLHVSAVLNDGYVYACLGDEAPNFLAAVRLADGKVMWRERGFPQAQPVEGDGKFILLDEEGQLALVKATPEKCTVISTGHPFEKKTALADPPVPIVAWTVPTLVGERLYLRDKRIIMALDVGKR